MIFTIKNADGQDAFFVGGKAFSWGDKLSFQDMSGKELAFIRQKLLSWGPTYEIGVHGKLVAVVKKKPYWSSPFWNPPRSRPLVAPKSHEGGSTLNLQRSTILAP